MALFDRLYGSSRIASRAPEELEAIAAHPYSYPMNIREYVDNDHGQCLALFDSNTPVYFASTDRNDFASFLKHTKDRYLVMEHPMHGIVACGGWYLKSDRSIGGLSWGMVHQNYQKQGFGTKLLQARIEELRQAGAVCARIRTTQVVQRFYEKAGFKIISTEPDGFGVGLDLVEMEISW